MNDCGCSKAQAGIEEFIRNELCDTDASEIQAHLEHCPECTDEQRVAERLREAVQRACQEAAPPNLRDVILANLRQPHTDQATQSQTH